MQTTNNVISQIQMGFNKYYGSPDGKQCRTPTKHGINEVINNGLMYSLSLL